MFSFDPVKTITCIDGGALVVRTEEEAQALREMRLIGMGQPSSVMYQNQRAWTYDVARLGFRYHMANLHAAIGLAQLGKLDVIARTRREACRTYNARLQGVPGITVPRTDFADVTPFLYYVRVEAGRRDSFRQHLAERGIDTGIHWQPGHWFTLFKDCRRGDLSVTERVGGRSSPSPCTRRWPPPPSIASARRCSPSSRPRLMAEGRALLRALKRTAGGADPAPCLPVGNPVLALLRPVGVRRERIHPADVAALTEWRNRFPQSFLTEFEATEARTLTWLTEAVAEDDGKILFMADGLDRRTFGYWAWTPSTGIAAPARPTRSCGAGRRRAGAMALGLTALLRWARGSWDCRTHRCACWRTTRRSPSTGARLRGGAPRCRSAARMRGPGEVAWVEDAVATALGSGRSCTCSWEPA
jgi:hypothetical protein